MSDLQNDIKSLNELVSSAMHQASGLLSNEIALARAEVAEKIGQVGGGAGMVVAGAVILIPALTLILLAIATGVMSFGMSPGVSYLITGAGAAVLAAIVIAIGKGRLSGEHLTPKSTIDEMRRNGASIREMVR
jgi:hypothetical protein